MDRRDRMAQYGGLPTGVTFDAKAMTLVHGKKAGDVDTCSEYRLGPPVPGLLVPEGPCGECQSCLDEDHGPYFCIPAKYEVCGTCSGKGNHVNPSIDAHGITSEEWANDWDDEDREAYHEGRYDVQCYECGGQRVVPVPNEDRATPEMMKAWEDLVSDDGEYRAECEAERRMGA